MTTYCIVHGRAHQPGETDSVDTCGDELYCRSEEWPEVVEGQVAGSHCEPADEESFFTLAAGNLGYLDTLTGLIPVKVGTITDDGEAEVKVTAGRPGYVRGEVLNLHVPNLTLVARTQVWHSRQRRQLMIHGPVKYVTESGNLL